jgi:maltooligosyltrehalose trehalohydrolase
VHHAAHVLATGERDGYYADYAARPLWHFGRCLAEGFAYQGDRSGYRADTPRGEPSAHLPATAFVNFLQTHDQVGNRAFGERLAAIAEPAALEALTACMLLAPPPPLLFMGEEFGAGTPFLFFCDFGPELAEAVSAGRRDEFARFERFRDQEARRAIPDPNAARTFAASKLDWNELDLPGHREILARHAALLAARREHVVPLLARIGRGGRFFVRDPGMLHVDWAVGGSARLHLLANLCDAPATGVARPPGRVLYSGGLPLAGPPAMDALGAWAVVWLLEE